MGRTFRSTQISVARESAATRSSSETPSFWGFGEIRGQIWTNRRADSELVSSSKVANFSSAEKSFPSLQLTSTPDSGSLQIFFEFKIWGPLTGCVSSVGLH